MEDDEERMIVQQVSCVLEQRSDACQRPVSTAAGLTLLSLIRQTVLALLLTGNVTGGNTVKLERNTIFDRFFITMPCLGS